MEGMGNVYIYLIQKTIQSWVYNSSVEHLPRTLQGPGWLKKQNLQIEPRSEYCNI